MATTPNQNSLEQDLIDLLNRRRGIEEASLDDARDLANFLQTQTRELKSQLAEKNSIRSVSRDIVKIATQAFNIQDKELGTLKGIKDLSKQQQLLEQSILTLSSLKNKVYEGDAKSQFEINQAIKEQIKSATKLKQEIQQIEDLSNSISKNFGVKTFGALSDVTKSIPGLKRFSEPFDKAAEAARKVGTQNAINKQDLAASLEANGKGLTREKITQLGLEKELGNLTGSAAAKKIKFLGLEAKSQSTLLAGTKSLGSSLSKAFGPAYIIYELVQAFMQLDNLAGDTAKSMGISYGEATQLNIQFNEMANSSNNIFVTTKGINESYNQINSALGTNANLSEELLVTQTQLTKQAFYSVEAATQISKLSLATGKPAKEIVTSFLGQAKALNLVNKTAINEKQLVEGISKTSKGILATFAAQPDKLIEAAYQAKKVGLELNEIKGIQDSLLNIESSIAAEFEAEVLTGQQMNLERARYYALTNNIAGLSQELTKQGIDQAKFAGMNVLQQESVAQAMGLSRDQLGGMLLDQAALSKLTKGDAEENRKKLAMLKEQGFSTQAIAELGQEEFDRQLNSASMQDKFNASVEKLKEIFVGVMASLMPIFDVFSSIFQIVGPIVNILMKGLMPAIRLIAAVLTPILEGLQWLFTLGKSGFEGTKASFSNFGKSLGDTIPGEILKATGAGSSMGGVGEWMGMNEVQDGIAPPGTGPFSITDRNGNTTITAANDGLAVSPNIRTQSAPQQSSPLIDYEKLGAYVAQAVSKVTVQTNLDGVNVSRGLQTPMGITTRKV
jgi:hypothetical protein